MSKKTTLQKIEELRGKIQELANQINELQAACPHPFIAMRVEKREVGFDGYNKEYTTSCYCELCTQSWFHDGWCDGRRHEVRNDPR